jgi:hypothetical protein
MRLSNRRIAKFLCAFARQTADAVQQFRRRRLQGPALPSDPAHRAADGGVGERHEAKLAAALPTAEARQNRHAETGLNHGEVRIDVAGDQLRIGGELCDFRQAERGDATIQDEAAACELRPFQRSFLFRQRMIGPADKIQRLAKKRFESQCREPSWRENSL